MLWPQKSHPTIQQMHPRGRTCSGENHRGGVAGGKGAVQEQRGNPVALWQLQGDLVSLLPVTQGPSATAGSFSLHVTSPWASPGAVTFLHGRQLRWAE